MRTLIGGLLGAYIMTNAAAFWVESTIRSGKFHWGGKTYWVVEQLGTGSIK